MKILQFALILCGCTILMNSCKKDPVDVADDNQYSTAAATNKCDYSPYSVGSTFTFEIANKDYFTDKWSYVENRGNMTGYQDIGGKKYTVGTGFFPQDSSIKASEGFIRCDATGMYVLAKGLNNGKDFELPLLQFPITKSKAWKSTPITITQNGASTINQYTFKVANTGLKRKVKNNTFNDVIEMDESLIATSQFSGQTITQEIAYKRYYDKKLGIIETIFFLDDPFTGVKDTAFVSRLVSYSIK